MMIKLQVKGNFKKTEASLIKIDKEFSDGSFLQRLAQLLNASIQVRVQRFGIGAGGKKLKMPYTKAYEKFKQGKGRSTNFRDLTFSGKMWNSLTTNREVNKARMFFGSGESANKAKGNNERTKFFTLEKNEKQIINQELNKFKEKL